MRLLRTAVATLLGRATTRAIHHRTASAAAHDAVHPSTSIADIERLALARKSHANLPLIRQTLAQLQSASIEPAERDRLQCTLDRELLRLPNDTHPAVRDLIDAEPRVLGHYGDHHQRTTLADGSPARQFADLCRRLNVLRTEHLGHFTGPKSYYLLNDLADLEHALVQFTVAQLRRRGGFALVSVPDILPAAVIEGCGMQTTGDRNQVYKVDADAGAGTRCMSGTAEMALAGYFAGKRLRAAELPRRVMAVSRCFRAETSGLQEEKGIYRVHTFTKVEMFAVCRAPESDAVLEEFRDIEIGLFERLRLPFRLLDMPPAELGAPAYRKYDIEAWLPGRGMYGEISSCSNCTDYQARRLAIRTAEGDEFVHTVNGTACAVPRMLIAIVENYQNPDGSVDIPLELQPYMQGRQKIVRTKALPELKLVKSLRENLI